MPRVLRGNPFALKDIYHMHTSGYSYGANNIGKPVNKRYMYMV